ncbi:MAG: sigma-70 family RNA polymerase sigma factor [Planctomycetaceae bacterium]|nr:sigma-70 family RNA polymerase sigma factor [Planctomycetaceae bacterium]
MPTSPVPVENRPPKRFVTTRWSLILQARATDTTIARQALDELCRSYWFPVYAFMRRQTNDIHLAQDWTQGLFASLLADEALTRLNPERGRFRSFLLAAARNFASNERDRNAAQKRGGNTQILAVDFSEGEVRLQSLPVSQLTPELLFEQQWALALLERVMNQLRDWYVQAGAIHVFEQLSATLSNDPSAQPLRDLAQQLQMSEEAVRVAMHRMRKRYRQILQNEVAQTTSSAEEVQQELAYLLKVLSQR